MSSRPLRLAYVGFALLGSAVLGAYLYDLRHPAAARPAAVARTAEPTAATIAPVVPPLTPAVTLKDLDGKSHALADWQGKALVINFWATWCAPCRREIPLLNRIRRDYAAKSVEVVGIAVDFADDVRAFTREFPISYPLLVGEEDGLEAARAFGVATLAFPFTAFTDRRGRLITLHVGELHPGQAEAILGIIARIDSGELTPESARAQLEAALEALPKPAKSGRTHGES
ncbi:MAG TPA: TlpA disulfide reductase family protein [Steroidobacteraceae bacterium]|nr:TlpA disulfide reductase family protein [Steroidobacteraceae bacterium]